jgi:large subunit ribosomal protein L25
MRVGGHIPAVLYGHGGENVSLSVPSDEMAAALRHGSKVVQLTGDVQQSALVREVQWDAFGTHLLHVDFTRVEAGESVETTVAIELRGTAPGSREGGIIEHYVHEVEIRCPVDRIPDKITLGINELGLDQTITADRLPLPSGAELLIDPTTVIVHCTVPAAVAEEEAVPGEYAEPEVIGRKAAEEEGEAEI